MVSLYTVQMTHEHSLREAKEYVGGDPDFAQPAIPPLNKKEFKNTIANLKR